jgi:murein DD-endopeptidase MepM/ murein hydrolase activator NlpD
MKYKLALTTALASFCAATALGVGMAGADPTSGNEAALLTTPSPAPSTVPSVTAPGCPKEIGPGGPLVEVVDPNCTPSSESPTLEPNPSQGTTTTTPAAETGNGAGGGAVQVGATINGNRTKPKHHRDANRKHGHGRGDESNATDGGVSFPSATGGEQEQPEATNGGSLFSNGGSPTPAYPTTTIASFGPAPIGIPNFVINSFEIPPFLLPIYQACGTQYGIPWEVLAAINKIETDFGTDLNVSSAGAVGWMQFLPSTWATWGVDANGDGRKDPYNPVDAICAAANYLHAAGGSHNLYNAILAYNHAGWYAQEVLTYARVYGKLPENLVGSLTGLTEGAHFPVAASSRYADEIPTRESLRQGTPGTHRSYGSAAAVISSSPTRRGINIFAQQGAPIVAVNDGVIKAVGNSRKLGKFIVLEDDYGNRYTYAELGQIVRARGGVITPNGGGQPLLNTQNLRPRLFALPRRQHRSAQGKPTGRRKASHQPLSVGAHVVAGTVIGRMGAGLDGSSSHINFAIRPSGPGAPQIDPKPILDGWKLLEATAIYRANGKSPFSRNLGVSGVLLLPKQALQQRVLADHQLSIHPCGRREVASGRIDRRVLALLEYLVKEGYRLKVSSLDCTHGTRGSSVKASPASGPDAVDISAVDGVPIAGHQGPGTLTNSLIKTVLRLQGTMHPDQVISHENLPGPISSSQPNYSKAVHIAYYPSFGNEYVSPFLNATTGRIDQGVDFTGTGPIEAVGDAQILQTGAPGWPEGGGVLYQLLDGSRAGQVIYVFEGIQATVHAGQRVSAGQQVGVFVPGGSIEMGFADTSGAPLSHNEYTEGVETVWGRKMAAFLSSIGGPSSLAPDLGQLSPEKWSRLIKRLGKIQNPAVRSGPSKYSLPKSKSNSGTRRRSGGSPSGH